MGFKKLFKNKALNAAKALGYSGSAVISVGDKIISPDKIAELLSIKKAKKVNAVWGAQVRSLNESGGRIVVRDGKIYGVVEQPDSALAAFRPQSAAPPVPF